MAAEPAVMMAIGIDTTRAFASHHHLTSSHLAPLHHSLPSLLASQPLHLSSGTLATRHTHASHVPLAHLMLLMRVPVAPDARDILKDSGRTVRT